MTVREIVQPMYDRGIQNELIEDSIAKAWVLVNSSRYNDIFASVSGGSDSDIVVDIINKVDFDKKVRYVFFDTGLEYDATKKHLYFLENKYGIKIERLKSYKSIPVCVKTYGQPFLSKDISQKIELLQKYNFEFDDTSDYMTLIKKYCTEHNEPCNKSVFIDGKWYSGCISSILWWCNAVDNPPPMSDFVKRNPCFNISRKKYLKEFLIAYPPKFKISDKCCKFAKKKTVRDFYKNHNVDLEVLGIRKSEGGIRGTSYKNCYSVDVTSYDKYRPIFWYTASDKHMYNDVFNIKNSDCYNLWGLKRTGCAGCPFDLNIHHTLSTIKLYEPRFYKAATSIFKDSYDYTEQYRNFVRYIKRKESGKKLLW